MPSPTEYKTIKAPHIRIAAERFYVLLEDGRELGITYDCTSGSLRLRLSI